MGRNSYLNTRRFNEAGLAGFENLSSPYHYQYFPGGLTRHLFFILFYPSFLTRFHFISCHISP